MKLLDVIYTKPGDFLIPAAWLSIADQIIIMILIPLVDHFVYPFLKKSLNIEICTRTRMVFGMIFACLSVVIAGIVETNRMRIIQNNSTTHNTLIPQVIDNTTYIAADFSILWQIPQYTLVGCGEVFCSIAGLFFAYSAAPKSMQSIIMGLFYFSMGMGSLLGSIILYGFHDLIYSKINHDDINCNGCHLDYYFYFLGALQFISILIFIIVDRKYGLTKNNNDKTLNCNNKNTSGNNDGKPSSYNKLPVSIRNRLKYNSYNSINTNQSSSIPSLAN
jgi:peptide/histidine transporter 3/4